MLSHAVFFFKQKTAYEMRISDWISDVCSSDLVKFFRLLAIVALGRVLLPAAVTIVTGRNFFAALSLSAPLIRVGGRWTNVRPAPSSSRLDLDRKRGG